MFEQAIIVIGTMEQEITLLHIRMRRVQALSLGSFTVHAGQYADEHMVLALSGIDEINAAVATAWMAHQLNPDCVINIGGTGGLGRGLKVGDVAIGSKTAHHDIDATTLGYEWGQVPRLSATFDAGEGLVGTAGQITSMFEDASARRGLVAGGGQFVHSSGWVVEICSRFPDIQAVEIETAAIAQACTQLGMPFVVIHTAPDSTGEEAGTSFDEFLRTTAVHPAEMVLKMMGQL